MILRSKVGGNSWFFPGVSANFLKDKIPVVVCHILTVYSVASLFTMCSEFGFVSKLVLFHEFLSVLSYQVSLRPTRLPVDVRNHVYLYFLRNTIIFFYFTTFPSTSLPTIPSVSCLKIYKYNNNKKTFSFLTSYPT